MPTEPLRISDQAQKAFSGGAWHGPSVLEALKDVDAEAAAAYPIPGAHSIWELVLHLQSDHTIVLRRIAGEKLDEGKEDDWWPMPAEKTEAAWQEALNLLQIGEDKLRHAMEVYPEIELDSPLVSGGTSAYNNFHGHIQHNAYHTGQIQLLKKAWRER